LDTCERRQAIGVAYTSDLNGEWLRLDKEIITPRWGNRYEFRDRKGYGKWLGASNPSAIIERHGTVILFYRGVIDNAILVATAYDWRGPYVEHEHSPVATFPSMGLVQVEDMFVFKTKTGCNILAHVRGGRTSVLLFAPLCTSPRSHWRVAPHVPYTKCVTQEDGKEHCYHRRERPQLLLDPNDDPIVLCTAVEEILEGSGRRKQFTLCVDIND
jgi:hypothetical protein